MGTHSWKWRGLLLGLAVVCLQPALDPGYSGALRANASAHQRDVPRPGAPGSGSVYSIRRSPPQTLTPRVVGLQGLTPTPRGWRAGRVPGILTLRLPALRPGSAGIGVTGRLVGQGAIQIRVRRDRTWTSMPFDEPSERDLPGAFGLWLAPGVVGDQVQLMVHPSDAQGVEIRDLQFDAPSPSTAVASSAPDTNLPGITVISRVGWGDPDGEESPRWIPFSQQPFHIIVHHTAAAPGPAGPVADMQAIWRFHTFDRGWGDIGYNYVIDPFGHIYEGRAGGDQVVAGHTKGFNPGAIGISLIGDYNVARPSAPMVHALQALITALADRYGIDVLSTGTDRGLRFDLLGGHRDFNLTDCPGTYAYDLLPALRTAVARAVHDGVAPAGPAVAVVPADSPSTALLMVRNVGTTTWNGRYTLRLRGAPPYGLPARYNLPDTPPGRQATVPLFLPALPTGTLRALRWDLYDASGVASGMHVSLTLAAGPAPEPSPTVAPAAAHLSTPTASVTDTPVGTATDTASPSPSASPTASTTPTASATSTPSSTRTPVASATRTATSTPTMTATLPRLRPWGTDTPVPPAGPHAAAVIEASLVRRGAAWRTAAASTVPNGPRATVPGRSQASVSLVAAPRMPAATSGSSATWYFAAGSSGQRDGETIAVVNPSERPAYMVATLLREDGRRIFLVGQAPPEGRATIDVGFAAGRGGVLAVVLRSTEPVLAERTLFHASPALDGTAGALTPGYAAASPVWYLPRLPLARDETERLSLLNPSAKTVTAAVSVVTHGRLHPYTSVRLLPLSVRPLALPVAVSSALVRVAGPIGTGIVVEGQTSYSADRGATVVPGLPTVSGDGYLPGPSGGLHDYAILLNPHPVQAAVTLTGLDAAGRPIAVKHLEVAAGGQAAVDLAGGPLGTRSALLVHASLPIAAAYAGLLGRVGEPAIAALYRGSVGSSWTQPTREISFAEGDTRPLTSNPREALIVTNTSDAPARIALTVAPAGSPAPERMLTLAPRATIRLNLSSIVAPGRHGLILRADSPVVAWHSIDLNRGAIRLLSPGIGAPYASIQD